MNKRFKTAIGLWLVGCTMWAQQKPSIRYKGMVEVGYSVGVGDTRLNRLELSTTQGCLFGSHWYVGAGVGLHRYTEDDKYFLNSMIGIPFYGNVRYYATVGNTNLFGSFKAGYTFSDIKGFYAVPEIGCRFSIGGRQNLCVSAGYTLQQNTFYYSREVTIQPDGSIYLEPHKKNMGAITFKLGYEF